jgi:PAS domain S-box-containing protein
MSKIVCVDDQIDNLISLSAVLRSAFEKLEFISVQDPFSAEETIIREQPDVIILDIIMPGLNGIDLCYKIRSNNRISHIPIMLLTAIRTDSKSRVQGLDAGADSFLSKPIEPSEIIAQTKALLRIKKAEDQLRIEKLSVQSSLEDIEGRLNSLIGNVEGIAYRCKNDAVWTMEFLSSSFEAITGYAVSDFIDNRKHAYQDIIHEDDRQLVHETVDNAVSNKQGYVINYRIYTKSGEIKHVFEKGQGVFYQDEVIALDGLIMDVTQRHVNLQLIEATETKYKKLIQTTSEGFWRINSEQITIEVNQSLLDILGYESHEVLGQSPLKFVNDENKEILKKQLSQANERKHREYEIVLVRKNGSKVPCLFNATSIENKEGKFIGSFAFVSDITLRKRAENIQTILFNIANAVNTTDSLDNLYHFIRKELSYVLDTSNFFIAMYDEERDLLTLPFIYDEKESMTIIPKGKSLSEYVFRNNKAVLLSSEEINELTEKGDVEKIGQDCLVWMGVPLQINDNTVGIIGMQSYKNENAFTPEDLRVLEFISGQIGLSINRKLTEENLQLALNQAQESDKLKSSFLTTMSHELRTPLNAIIGFSDIINDPGLDLEDILEFNKSVNESGKHLLKIVEDIFDISMIESGQLNVTLQEFSLSSFMGQVLELAKVEETRCGKEGLTSMDAIPEALENAEVFSDFERLTQILINLISNAIKFTNEGSINYGVQAVSKGNIDLLKFYVRDSGIGIAKEHQGIIFDIFRQADESYTRRFGGTGIGLAICKQLSKKLGGEIWLESEYGVGSTFYFTIQYKNTNIEDIVVKQVPSGEMDLNGVSILVVEDIDISYELMEIILTEKGARVQWAENGQNAIDMVRSGADFDLILMDINMPIMNGYEAAQEIMKIKPEIPIIAQTAYAVSGDEEKAIQAGCAAYIPKPINRHRLYKTISTVLKR